MEFAFRINLLSLVLATFALNIALVLASSASAVALEQPRLSDAGDAAEEEISYYRQQPLALTQERFARAGASGGKVPFYPNYRFGSVRLITPYALQHLLASRFQNADYPGKRMGSEFLGKKRSSPSLSEAGSLDSVAYAVMQKKMGSEFLGRRKRHTEQ